jgi:inosose dehydratase
VSDEVPAPPATLPFRFGNECYTWFMKDAGAAHANRLDHMIRVTAESGLAGIEPIHSWMGDLADAGLLRASLAAAGIELAAIALVLDWNHAAETDDECRQADQIIDLLAGFPGAMLCTVQMPTSREDVETRRLRLVDNVNAVSRRAADRGVASSFHPNSPPHSINRTPDDYAVILEGLDPAATGWTPDVGHIINGGMDPLDTMKRWQSLINHVHYKDWDGEPEFALMGEGSIDFAAITRWLRSWDYSGWIILEDEAERAIDDPDGVTLHDGEWVHQQLIPRLQRGA